MARGRPPGPRIASSAANPVGTTEPRTEPTTEPTSDSADSTDSANAPIGRPIGSTSPPLPQRSAPFPHFCERSEMAPSRASEGRAMRPVSIEHLFDYVNGQARREAEFPFR
jgi:hypothetical protein